MHYARRVAGCHAQGYVRTSPRERKSSHSDLCNYVFPEFTPPPTRHQPGHLDKKFDNSLYLSAPPSPPSVYNALKTVRPPTEGIREIAVSSNHLFEKL